MTLHTRVAIVGTGFAGLGMAAQLKRRGESDFVVFERASEVGGTWRDNTYPGAACDIRSDLYSFSFAPNPDWSRTYGQQAELLDYLRGVARDFGIVPHIRFNTEFERADWDEGAGVWRIRTSTGELTANILVSGTGPLVEPVFPALDGLESFPGPRFHSARWDHGVALDGKRIAVLGTGASAIQFVPELQKVASQLTVFQRTPAWIVPRADKPTSERRRRLFRRFPWLQRISRSRVFRVAETQFLGFRSATAGHVIEAVASKLLHDQVADPSLRARLSPNYRMGCKRILISSRFYPALTKPNVELVTSPITLVEGATLVTDDGERREFDVLICATGFNATRPPIGALVFGRDGRSLRDAWEPHMQALRGSAVAGFPNFFVLVGPNTALGHNSIVYIIEAQIDYVLQALDLLDRSRARALEPSRAAQEAYNRELQADLASSVWVTGGCTSFYLDAGGRNTTLWPHRAASFRASVRRLRPSEFVLDRTETAAEPVRLAR